MITVRQATADDAVALAELRWEFRTAPDRDDAPAETRNAFVQRCAAWMAHELSAVGPWRAWVAVAGDRIVGQLWLNLIHKVPNPVGERERHAYLSNLFVTPDARGGVGTRLLETALAWAQANTVDRIVLWPSRRSVQLYLRHGFVRTGGSLMELAVGEDSAT